MTFQCPKCGYLDSAIWKPLYWKLYGAYADLTDFKNEYPQLVESLLKTKKTEDQYYEYELKGKTRQIVHRFPKAFKMMRKRKLYEKTPNERVKQK